MPYPTISARIFAPAGAREFQFFQHQDAGAFAHHEAIAIPVPRAGCAQRIVVARGKRAHGGESADPHGRDAGLRAAADHGVGIAVLNHPERIADGMRAGGAGRRGGRIRPFGAAADGNIARRQIDDGGRNKKRRDAPRPVLEQRLVLALDDFESADAAADINADAFGDLGRRSSVPSRCRANSAAAMANWMKRPIFLISFFSM